MASSKEYLKFILGQLSEFLEEITYRAMIGEFIIYYRSKIPLLINMRNSPRLCHLQSPFLLTFRKLFKFMHAKVSATFIFIRAFPYIYVYWNPWFSFAVPKILSIVSFRCAYKSFIPVVSRTRS